MKAKVLWAVTAFTILAVCAGAAAWLWEVCSTPYGRGDFPKYVLIPPGASLREVSSSLEQAGLLRMPISFLLLAWIRGDQGRIKAGEYRFAAPVSPRDLLDKLCRGEVMLHAVTIPEGWTVKQIANRLSQEGLVDERKFLSFAMDPEFAASLLGFAAPSLEGFLFPDTYMFAKDWGEERILKTMVERFMEVFDTPMREKAHEMGWSILQVVTLASLIEKETALPRERPLISGVFHRRLRMGMRLESDPSVIYGLRDFHGNLKKEDLAVPHPYNTYVNKGLPPGPICNPGRESIMAALFPSDEGYLYFVSKNDGSHFFSKTYKVHQRAVRRYQMEGQAPGRHK